METMEGAMGDFWTEHRRWVVIAWLTAAVAGVMAVALATSAQAIGPGVVTPLATLSAVTVLGIALPLFWRRQWRRLEGAERG